VPAACWLRAYQYVHRHERTQSDSSCHCISSTVLLTQYRAHAPAAAVGATEPAACKHDGLHLPKDAARVCPVLFHETDVTCS
jgi:hypothetical protein